MAAGKEQPRALWEQVAGRIDRLARAYRAPLSLSIFRGGKDYLVTDGPFADPLDLWCAHAHGHEPTQRSIGAILPFLSARPSPVSIRSRSRRFPLPGYLAFTSSALLPWSIFFGSTLSLERIVFLCFCLPWIGDAFLSLFILDLPSFLILLDPRTSLSLRRCLSPSLSASPSPPTYCIVSRLKITRCLSSGPRVMVIVRCSGRLRAALLFSIDTRAYVSEDRA